MSSTTSNSSQQQVVTSIPTSTVVAIGGGFIAFALCVFASLSLSRSIRIFIHCRRANPRIPFRQAWNDEGGFWGFFNGMSMGSGHENMMLGMYGGRDMRGWRVWEESRAWELFGKEKNMKNPEMWEVEVEARGEKVQVGQDDLTQLIPISITAPQDIDSSKMSPLHDPVVSIAVLIQFPSPEIQRIDDSTEEELPDLLIGTTTLLPYMSNGASRAEVPDSEKDKLDEEHVEYSELGRRAGWVKTPDEKWAIEGL